MKRKLLSRRDMMKLSLASFSCGLLLPSCKPLLLGQAQSEPNYGPLLTPQEPSDPYSGHDARFQDVLHFDGILRSDIRPSLGTTSGSYFFLGTATAGGLPLTIDLSLRGIHGDRSRPLGGLAVYLWHCDREGLYSMYDEKIHRETYLRGVQMSDDQGKVSFRTVFPGCEEGRMPHVYVEIYESFEEGEGAGALILATQLTFPIRICRYVYKTCAGYGISSTHLSVMDYANDQAFADGYRQQLFSMVGNYTTYYQASASINLDDEFRI